MQFTSREGRRGRLNKGNRLNGRGRFYVSCCPSLLFFRHVRSAPSFARRGGREIKRERENDRERERVKRRQGRSALHRRDRREFTIRAMGTNLRMRRGKRSRRACIKYRRDRTDRRTRSLFRADRDPASDVIARNGAPVKDEERDLNCYMGDVGFARRMSITRCICVESEMASIRRTRRRRFALCDTAIAIRSK